MYLADTSVWISHFNRGDKDLAELLRENKVLIHPIVLGELRTGQLKDRDTTLSLLELLPKASEATHEECAGMIERMKLYGVGLSYADIQIFAGALLSGAVLITKDKALSKVVAMTVK